MISQNLYFRFWAKSAENMFRKYMGRRTPQQCPAHRFHSPSSLYWLTGAYYHILRPQCVVPCQLFCLRVIGCVASSVINQLWKTIQVHKLFTLSFGDILVHSYYCFFCCSLSLYWVWVRFVHVQLNTGPLAHVASPLCLLPYANQRRLGSAPFRSRAGSCSSFSCKGTHPWNSTF